MPKKRSADKQLGQASFQRRGRYGRSGLQSAEQALDKILNRPGLGPKRALQGTENRKVFLALRDTLPAELAAHLRSADIQNEQLCVSVDSAAWAERLRYVLRTELPRLQQQWPLLQTVRLKIARA
jgi:Dna[CI] antecedent, DciA